MKILFRTALVLALLPVVVKSIEAAPIRVFAAASLTEVFKDIGAEYLRLHPGDPVEFSFAGSPTLRTQIQEGAPVDVFAAADRPNMDALAARHLVGRPQIFACNTMVVVVPAASTRVRSIGDLAGKEVRIVLAESKVPAGHYAEQILGKMTPAVQKNFAKRVLANVVSRETDVKAVLAKVALGEADAGVVFKTDAAAAGRKVRTIAIRAEFNVIGEYPIAAVKGSPNPTNGDSFIKYVLGPDGQAILRAHGFLSARAAKP